jgi:radical S-adenosyl methionine domain-containing protein 2
MFKLNTVVCRLSFEEDMNKHVAALNPFRWKYFQVLLVPDENDSQETLREVRRFIISDEDYDYLCSRHRQQKAFVPELNRLMAKSYLILDEYMCFLDRDGRQPSPSVLEVGVQGALSRGYWDEDSFKERGGVYDWQRTQVSECVTSTQIEW